MPEMPDRPPPNGDTAVFTFKSTFTGTQLECSYQKGLAVYKSDNLSTMAILRDVLSKEATRRNMKLQISVDISDESVAHTLQLLHPKLEYHLNLSKKAYIAEALKELSMNEQDISFLSEELVDIHKRSEELLQQHEKQQANLERLYGVVTDLYIDKFKFKGINVKSRIPQLLQILDNYSLEALLTFFNSSSGS